MKSDLNRLMKKHDLDVILVTGPGQHNPAMYYLTGGGHMTSAELIKVIDQDPVLYYNPMERDEAAATGLKTKNLALFNQKQLLEEAQGDAVRSQAVIYRKMLTELDITSGRMAIYGK